LRIRRESAIDEVLALVPVLDQIIPGGGEPLLDRGWRRLITTTDVSSNPYLQLATTTNASLVSDEILAGLERFKRVAINVSLDGGSRGVFERIRRNGKWDQVVGNIDRLLAMVRRKGPPSFVSATMSVMKANVLDIPNLVEFALRRGMTFGLSPVVSMPVDQSLTCFNDPAAETAGWREAIAEAQARFTRLSLEIQGRQPPPHTHFDVLEQTIPWEVLDRPHFAVEGLVPDRVTRNCRRQFTEEVLVGVFPAAGRRLEECRYYAPLEGRRFRVALPEGEYALGFFPRNRYASPLPSYRVRVVQEGEEARLETVRLPWRGASAAKAIRTLVSRFLPRSSKRMVKQLALFFGRADVPSAAKRRADVPSAAKRARHSFSEGP